MRHICTLACSLALLLAAAPFPARAQAQTGPAGHWRLDEGAGTAAADSSGHGNAGTLQGGAAWVAAAGVPRREGAAALSLSGTGSVDVAAPVVDTGQSFTVSAWVRVRRLGGYQTFVSVDGDAVSGFFLQLRDGGSFALTRLAADNPQAVPSIAAATTEVDPGTWYFLLGVYDAAARTVSLYVDGVLQQTTPFTAPWRAGGHTEIGRGKFGGNLVDFCNADIADVRVYGGVQVDRAELAQIARETHALDPATLAVNMGQAGPRISPLMYGLMIEDISHSIDGGLYAELIQNRAFKDNPNTPAHWSLVPGAGAGTMSLDTSQPVPATALTTALRLDVTSAGVGVANDGYWGIPVRPSTQYRASFYAKAGPGFTGPLTASLESSDGAAVFARAAVPGVTPDWKKYTVTLTTGRNAPASTANRFVVSSGGVGTVWLTQISLMPPTYHNRPNGARVDLMQPLAAIKPAFLRMPGGNYVEGNTIPERFDWKRTIGDISQRPGHQDPWGYRSNDGFGLLEYLEWCEDLHMEPLLAVYAGYSLQGAHVNPGPDLAPFVQDALDEIEYVTGGTATKWGARRAADGHPAPFPLHYVEVGNEDFFDQSGSYNGRFAQFHDAIKAKYPALQLIATRGDVAGVRPDVVDDHFYRSARDFEGDSRHYDRADRSGPKTFVGEYATQSGKPTPDLNGALGDAAWMVGMERNADVVVLASYAPLLVNVNPGASQWDTNLIGFDALRSYVSPAYYVQKLFSLYHGDAVVPSKLSGGGGLFAVAGRGAGVLYVKLVNTSGAAQDVAVAVAGARSLAPRGTAITLKSALPSDTNTLADPDRVRPVQSVVTGVGPHFTYTLAPYSVTVLQLKAK